MAEFAIARNRGLRRILPKPKHSDKAGHHGLIVREKHMNKRIISCVIAAAMALGSTAACAKDLTGWYVGGSVGTAHSDANALSYDLGSTNTTAGSLIFGYRTQFIGFDLGFTDLGTYSASDGVGDRGKLSANGITFGISGHFNPTRNWYISTRVGGFQWHVKGRLTQYDGDYVYHYAGSRDGLGYYLGVGTGYDISRKWSVGVAYDYYRVNKHYQSVGNYEISSGVASVKAEFRF